MSIKSVPAKFETSDRREHVTREDAVRHQAFLEAKEAYEDAARVMGQRLAESTRTADGYFFEVTMMRDYWRVVPWFQGQPALRRVDGMNPWMLQVRERDGAVCVGEWVRDGASGLSRYIEHPICELYENEKAARRALLAEQEKWLKECRRTVEETREKVIAEAARR